MALEIRSSLYRFYLYKTYSLLINTLHVTNFADVSRHFDGYEACIIENDLILFNIRLAVVAMPNAFWTLNSSIIY